MRKQRVVTVKDCFNVRVIRFEANDHNDNGLWLEFENGSYKARIQLKGWYMVACLLCEIRNAWGKFRQQMYAWLQQTDNEIKSAQ